MNLSTVSKAHAIRTVLLVCVALLSISLSAQSLQARLSLEVHNATLPGFVRQLENSTGFTFVNSELVSQEIVREERIFNHEECPDKGHPRREKR